MIGRLASRILIIKAYLIISYLTLILCGCKPSKIQEIESTLGVSLPNTVSNCNVRISRNRDYNHVELSARFNADAEVWTNFCKQLGLHSSHTLLPYEKIPPDTAEWWDVPPAEKQKEKAGKVDSRGVVDALWWNGFIYVEFGGFPPASGK